MKKTVSYLLIIILAVTLLFSVNTVAFAADDVKMKVSVSPSSLSAPGPVKISVTLTNAGDMDASNIVLTYPQPTGNEISMGGLAPGATGDHTNPSWNISEDMLNRDLVFTLSYTGVGADGTPVQKTMTASVKIEKKDQEVKVSGSSSVDKTEVNKDDKVKFTFVLNNEGNVTLENVKLNAPPIEDGSQLGDTFTLEAGKKKTMTYTISATKDMEVKPVFTYTAGGKEGKTTLETRTVKVANTTPEATQSQESGSGGLVAVLVSDFSATGATPGQEVKLNLDINNSGSKKITDLAAKDSAGNAVVFDKTTLAAGESAIGVATVKVDATTSYKFDVTGKTEDGTAVSLTSNTVEIAVTGPSQAPSPSPSVSPQNAIKIRIGVSTTSLAKPGTVDFTVTAINKSEDVLSNIVVKEATLGAIGTLAQLSAGTEESFPPKTVEVTETSSYVFSVSAQMSDGTLVESSVSPIEITVEGEAGADNNMMLLIIIIIAIAVVAVVLVLYLLKQKKKGGMFGGKATSSSKGINKNERPKPQYASQKESPRGKPKETQRPVRREAAKPQRRNENFYDERLDSADQEEDYGYEDRIEQTQRVQRQKQEMYEIEPVQESEPQPQHQPRPTGERPQSTSTAAPRRAIGVQEEAPPPPAPKPSAPVKKDRNNF